MSHYEMAQKYAQHGYVCLPVSVYLDDDGKKNAEFPTEYKSASFDNPEDWEGFTGLAINTALSGIVVVDIDKGPDKDGWAGLHDAGIELPDTPMKATTQSGGEHWYYRRNSSVPVAQSSGLLADDVDIRGDASGIVYVFPTEVGNGVRGQLIKRKLLLHVLIEVLGDFAAAEGPVLGDLKRGFHRG